MVNSNEQRTSPIYKVPSPNSYATWNLRRLELDTIYKVSTFDFIKAYSVKTHEEVISLQNGLQTIRLSHLKDKYHFIHIGLVQVAITPLLKKGINAPIYMALRDNRLRKYKSSLLAVIQTNI